MRTKSTLDIKEYFWDHDEWIPDSNHFHYLRFPGGREKYKTVIVARITGNEIRLDSGKIGGFKKDNYPHVFLSSKEYHFSLLL